MKIKDIERVILDYNTAAVENVAHYDNSWSMRRLFAPNTENRESVTDYNLANNVGELSLDTLTEFIISNLFAQKEDWLKIDMTTDMKKVKDTERKLIELIDQSNFLEEISKMVREGNIWKMGYIDAKYMSGLCFKQYMADSLVIPKAVGSLKRGYALTTVKLSDLNIYYTNFENIRDIENSKEDRQVLQCVLPLIDDWVENPDKRYKYARFEILINEREVLIPRNKDHGKMNLFPFIEYTPYTTRSLARKAHVAASHADYYEKLDSNSAEWRHNPPYEIDIENIENNNANLYPGGKIPTSANQARTQAVQAVTTGDQYTAQKIAVNEQKVRNIFKVPQIEALTNLSLSQYEYHDKRAKVLELLVPVIGNLPAVISDLLLRSHVLLFDNDKEYRKLVGTKDLVFKQVGVKALIQKYRDLAGVGRSAQALAPFAQMGLNVGGEINSRRLTDKVTGGVGVSDIMNTQEEQQEIAEAQAQREQEMRQLEQDEQRSQIEANRAKTEGI